MVGHGFAGGFAGGRGDNEYQSARYKREVIFHFSYLFLALCFITPPVPFVKLGLTVQGLLSRRLGNESTDFVMYNVRRTTFTLVAHAILLIGYLYGVYTYHKRKIALGICVDAGIYNIWWLGLFCAGAMVVKAFSWSLFNWRQHPIIRQLSVYPGSTYQEIAESINIEYLRVDKVVVPIGNNFTIITNNWVILTSTYNVHFAHQSDVDVTISGAIDIPSVEGSTDLDQILSVKVTSVRPHQPPFVVRMDSLRYQDFEDHIRMPVRNMREIAVRQSLSDQFLTVLKDEIERNEPCVDSSLQDDDKCVGCLGVRANVKLKKHCDSQECRDCPCRPMWCLPCLAKWFASRQPQNYPERWMQGRGECPTCRATFCVRDIHLLSRR
eukprot:m.10347 g.10347  ORF g.10347 m.10347 type:complete len:381 (+) comp4247_c0_seq1:216-1358(+)